MWIICAAKRAPQAGRLNALRGDSISANEFGALEGAEDDVFVAHATVVNAAMVNAAAAHMAVRFFNMVSISPSPLKCGCLCKMTSGIARPEVRLLPVGL